jgi:23S rRNA (cytosine1962-C5)-methyltransferase
VEDALKFARREVKRGHRYDGIILDPPAYGRGPEGEKWVLEQNISEMLALCAELLNPQGFLVLNLYSMGLSAMLAKSAVNQLIPNPQMEQFGELYFTDRQGKSLPLGVYYRCKK